MSKILISISFYHPYVSGLTICAKNYAEGLAERGYQVSVLTTQHDRSLAKNEINTNVHIIRVPFLAKLYKGFFMPSYIFNAWRQVSSHDIIVINLPQLEGCILALFGVVLRKKIITIYHCEVALPKSWYSTIIEYILLLSHTLTLLCSTSIVSYTKDYALSTKLLPSFLEKCHFITPPIRPPLHNSREEANIRNHIQKDTFVIGVAARIASEKGIEYLLAALSLLKKRMKKNILILFAGPKNPVGEKAYWKKLQPLLDMHAESLHFLDTVSSEKLGSFYSLLDVLVLPSINKTEAFGMVQVEAMMMGIPVVASNLPGVRTVIRDTGMGEVAEVKDAVNLAEKIQKVLEHKRAYTKHRNIILRKYSFQESIDTFEKLLHN